MLGFVSNLVYLIYHAVSEYRFVYSSRDGGVYHLFRQKEGRMKRWN